jgi:hypothetical protein
MPPTALVLVLTPGKRDDVVLIPEVAAWAERQRTTPEVVLITQGSPVHLAALASEHGLEFAEVRPAIEPHPSPCAVVIEADGGVSDAVRGPDAVRALLRGQLVRA